MDENGLGVSRDHAQALARLHKAAATGDTSATTLLHSFGE